MTRPVRILVCGSRGYTDGAEVFAQLGIEICNLEVRDPKQLTIVHGACPTGADALADRWATEFGCNVERFPADWNIGKRAGPMRNELMAKSGADLCVAFWDGESTGTLDMIRRATARRISVHIYPRKPTFDDVLRKVGIK